MVTQLNKNYRKELELDKKIFSYIQFIDLKKTFEIIVNGSNKFHVLKNRRTIEDYLERSNNIKINELNFTKKNAKINN